MKSDEKNHYPQQHLPKSGGSVVKSSFVLLSKFVQLDTEMHLIGHNINYNRYQQL
jgi:hypothetical protein